jgi:hypothetical protein
MSPTYIRPPPTPPPLNRQPVWVFWMRRYTGLAFMLAAGAVLAAANSVCFGCRPRWVTTVASSVIRLAMWISPMARHVSMKPRRPGTPPK